MSAKSSSRFKTIAAAGLLSAALVGCGGGSESTVSKTPEPTPTPGPSETQQAVTRAQTALTTAQDAFKELPADATYEQKRNAQQAIQTAASDLARAQQANGDSPAMANTAAMAAKAQVDSLNSIIKAVDEVETAYKTAKALIDGLVPQSTNSQRDTARDSLNTFSEIIAKTPDLPDSEHKKYTDLVPTLSTSYSLKAKQIVDYRTDEGKKVAIGDAVKSYVVSKMIYTIPPANPRGSLNDKVGDSSSLTSKYTSSGGASLKFEYGGTPLAAEEAVSVGATGWTGNRYERDYGSGRVDSGRFFTNIGKGDEKVEVAAQPAKPAVYSGKDYTWDEKALQQLQDKVYGNYVTMNFTNSGVPSTDQGKLIIKYTSSDIADGKTVTVNTNIPFAYIKNTPAGTTQIPLDQKTALTTTSNYDVTLFASASSTKKSGIEGAIAYTQPTGSAQASVILVEDSDGNLDLLFKANGTGAADESGDYSITFTPTSPSASEAFIFAGKKLVTPAQPKVDAHEKQVASYIQFGYWSYGDKDNKIIGIATYAEGFYSDTDDKGTTHRNPSEPDKLEGIARYDGPAAGYYALMDTNKQFTGNNGEFVADITLTANFSTDKIGGTISNFNSVTDNNHDDDIDTWTLTLDDADIDDSNATAFLRPFSGSTDGGAGKAVWQGEFYGNSGSKTTAADEFNDDYPEAVVGEFAGNFTNGIAAGAFGAEKRP